MDISGVVRQQYAHLAPRPRRSAFMYPEPMWQAPSGAAMVDQAGYRPRWAPHARVIRHAGRFFIPGLGQQSQAVPFPLVTRGQPGAHPRFNPKQVQRARLFIPGFGQAGQGVQFPLIHRGQPGWHPRWAPYLRRGKYFIPRFTIPVPPLTFTGTGSLDVFADPTEQFVKLDYRPAMTSLVVAGHDLSDQAECQVATGSNVPAGTTNFGFVDTTYSLTKAQILATNSTLVL